jgi:hypothetical protein
MHQVERTEDEIAEQRTLARPRPQDGGTSHRGQTYEDGVASAFDWLFGDRDEPPFGLPDVES